MHRNSLLPTPSNIHTELKVRPERLLSQLRLPNYPRAHQVASNLCANDPNNGRAALQGPVNGGCGIALRVRRLLLLLPELRRNELALLGQLGALLAEAQEQLLAAVFVARC